MPKALDLYDKEEFYRCLQCAICTGSCPVAQVVEGFNPREIILRYILDGEQDEVLNLEAIWCCTTCQVCQERCPHDIRITGLLIHIMNLAARRGNLPSCLREGVRLMIETGWSIPAPDRANRVRQELGLKPLKRPNTKEIGEILEEAGLGEIMDMT
jgi:heterodisulfide reductase subunit C